MDTASDLWERTKEEHPSLGRSKLFYKELCERILKIQIGPNFYRDGDQLQSAGLCHKKVFLPRSVATATGTDARGYGPETSKMISQNIATSGFWVRLRQKGKA